MKALPLDVAFLSRTEELVLHWVEQIHAFIFEQGEASSPLELGLLHEIRQLSSKGAALEELTAIVNTSGVRKVTAYVESQNSPVVILLKEALDNLEMSQKRLRETGGQLSHMEHLLDLLYSDTVQALTEHMYDVLALLRIIWTHSEYYHKPEVMAEICIRVSWEVTRACQVHLPLDQLLSHDFTNVRAKTPPSSRSASDTEESKSEGKDSLALVEVAIKCCNDWRNCYTELASHFGEQDWPEVWLPENAAVFLPVELFASRCEDLKYIGLSKQQLTRHGESGSMSVKASGAGDGGAEGELLEEELAQVDRVLEDALKAISRRSHLVFNLTSKEWLRHFDKFRESMEEVERRYQCVMVAAVQTVETVAQGLRVLNVFKPLAARKSLFSVFYVMIDHILNLFDRDFEEVEKEYVFRSMKVGNVGFYFSKMAKWANDTRRKLEQEVNLLKNQSWLPYYPRLDSIYLRWSRTAALLRGVVTNMYAAWNAHLEPHPAKRLLEPIFRWKPGPVQNLQDNFDKQLYKNLEEARAWKAMGFDVPDGMTSVFNDSERLLKLKKQIAECTDDFNKLMSRLSRDEAQMFEGQIQMIIKNFFPGLSFINWTQQDQCSLLLAKCKTIVKTIQDQVTHYLDINQAIANDMDKIKDCILYYKEDEDVYIGDAFIKDIVNQREATLGSVIGAFLSMEEELESLHSQLINKSVRRAQDAWIAYIQRLDQMFLECQREILRKSLLTFEGMLMGSRSCPMDQLPPVFQISTSLKEKNIVCNPSVFAVLNVVTSLSKDFAKSLSKVPCLLRKFAADKSKDHNHTLCLKDELCDKLQNKLAEEFQIQVDMLKVKLEEWQIYRDVWEIDRKKFFEEYLKKANSVEVFETDIISFQNKLSEIESKDEFIKVGTFSVDCKKLKKQIITLCKSWVQEFEDNLFKIASDRLTALYQYSERTKSLLESNPEDIPSLLSSAEECDKARQQLELYEKEFQPVREQFTVLKQYHYSVPCDIDNRLADLESEWSKVEGALTNKILDLNSVLDGYRKKYSDRAEIILEEVEELRHSFHQNLPVRADKRFEEAKEAIDKLQKMTEEVEAKMDINEYLGMLSMPLVDFDELPAFKHDLIAAEKIWCLLKEWQNTWESWANIVVWEVSVVTLQETLSVYGHKIRNIKSYAVLESDDPTKAGELTWEINEEVLSHIELCKLLVPLTLNLQNATLKPHHWSRIQLIVKTEFDKDSEDFTLGYLQKINLTSYEKEITEILVDASEETKIVADIHEIEILASQITVNLKTIVSMGISVIQSTSEANSTIVELNTRLQTVSASFHAKPYLEEIDNIQSTLSSMISFLEGVEELQRKWATLEPFFHVADVRYHMVNATALFDSLDERWRTLTSTMVSEHFLQPIVAQQDLLEEVSLVSKGFDDIPSHIQPYLQDRREQYFRLWLLSDDDLMAAVSTLLDGEFAKPFLPKLFTNVAKIKQEKNSQIGAMEIIGVFSKEGEFLELNSYVPILGPFDTWLQNLSAAIEATLKENTKQCRNSIKTVGIRLDEILKLWPLQVASLAFMTNWTTEMSRALAKFKGHMNAEQLQPFKKRIKDSQQRLDGCLQGNLSKLIREKFRLFYMNLLQVRDFLNDISESRKGFTNESEMMIWHTVEKDTDNLLVHFGTSEMMYSWEYQGLWSFGVMTPSLLQSLTDIAKVLNKGASAGVFGVSGCGKTESVKMMAHLLGRHLVTISCTASLTSSLLVRSLLGTCSSHSWLFLENANRLDAAVVPVLGEVIQVIQNVQKSTSAAMAIKTPAKTTKLQQQPIKLLEGVQVSVSPLSAVLMELDTRQASSRDIMDTLRETFKPALIFTPNLQVITECFMLVEGFKEYKVLSQKLSHALQTLSTSLPQVHKRQLEIKGAAGVVAIAKDVMKRQPEIDEIDTVPVALKEYITPQLQSSDIPIFQEVFEQLFPDFDAAPYVNDTLRDTLVKMMEENNLILKDCYIDKILQLHDVIAKNQKVILYGSSKSGKSTSLRMLESAYNTLNKQGNPNYKSTKIEVLNPLAVEQDNFYGPFKDIVGKAEEGYFPHMIRKYLRSNLPVEYWIVLEGPTKHRWLKDLFLHFHPTDNSFLSGSSQRTSVPPNMRFIVEISGDISQLSPFELTQCYSVYFQQQPNLWEDIIQSWLGTITNDWISRALQTLIKKNLPSFIKMLKPDTVTKPSMVMKAKAFVAILRSLLDTDLVEDDTDDWVAKLTPAFIFSIIWSFGANISPAEADEFKEVVTRMIENVPEGSIYDYYVDTSTGHFTPWWKTATELGHLVLTNPLLKTNIIFTDRILKYSKVAQLLLNQGIPVLLKGEPGSGKSTILSVLKQTSDEFRHAVFDSYTASTKPKDIQDTVMKNLSKHGKDILASRKSKVHFLMDDLQCNNDEMSLQEILETVRFTENQRKIYCHDSKSFLMIPEICYLFTYQTKESDKANEKSQILSENVEIYWSEVFHMLTLPPCQKNELEIIFGGLFDQMLGHFEQDVKCMKSVIAEGIVHLYERMGEMTKARLADHLSLLHHPRQIVSVLKGLQLADVETQDRDNFLKHLSHECYRVFQDSGILTQNEFDKLLSDVLTEYLCVELDSVRPKGEIFLLTRLGNEEELYTDASVEEINSILLKRGHEFMGQNQNFALHDSLLHHAVHLARVIGGLDLKTQSAVQRSSTVLDNIGGHLVLVGPEGCGKKTCARLVAMIAGYKIHDIIGTATEPQEKTVKILEDLRMAIPVLVVIDWNILESLENISFLNSILVDELNNEKTSGQETNIRIMMSVPSMKEAYEIFRYIPAASCFFTVDYFQEWNTHELQSIAKQILSETLGKSLSDIKTQCVSEIMAYIHSQISDREWNPSARFLEFLKLVLVVHNKLHDNIVGEKEKLKVSIQKFEETQRRVTELSRQLEEQRAQVTYIQQSCGSVVLKMRNIKSEQGRLQKDLNKNAALLKRQKDEAQRIRELINRDLTAPKLEMKAIHRKLDRITKAELEGLKGLGRPSQGVELIFDAVLTTLGLDPSWNEAKKQMANGLNFISSIRKIPVEETDEKVLARIQSYLKMEELDSEQITEESYTAATFLNWLNTFEKYVRVYKDYHPLKVQADIIARDIDATEEVIAKYEEDLSGFGMEHEVLMAQLKEKEQHLEVAEEEMKVLEGRIQLAQKVMSQLGEDKIQWEEALSHCSVKLRNIFGDAVLAAAYVTYMGNFLHCERQGVMKDWQKKMDELCIFHTEDKDVMDVLAPLELQVRWHEEGLPHDTFSLENAAIIYNSNLPQLILDPHSFMESWIRNWGNVTEIDLDNDYMPVMEQTMAEGKTAVLIQEELELPMPILQILEMECVVLPNENKCFLKVGEKLLQVHQNFRLIIILRSREVNLNNNMKTLVNIVNMQSQQEGLMKLLTFRAASHCQPDLFESLKKSEWDLLEKQNLLAEHEATIRELMSRFDDDVLEESTLMEMLQATCGKATETKKRCHDLRRNLDVAREGNNTYRKISGLLTSLYLLVEHLPEIHPSLVMGVNAFSELIIGEMSPQSFAIPWGRMLGSNTVMKMLQTFYRHIQQQVSDITVVTIGLILATWYECHISLTNPKFCSLLYSSLTKEKDSAPQLLKPVSKSKHSSEVSKLICEQDSEKSRPAWLTNAQWAQLLELSKIEPFSDIINHITTYKDLWRVWYVTEQPETGSFPKSLDKKVRGVAKLVLINCLRPDRLDEAALLYATRVLKQETTSTTAKALLSVAAKGSVTEPIILYSSAPLDVEHLLRQIQPLCHPVLTTNPDAVNILSLGQGREKYLNLIMRKCAEKGYWLLLKKNEADQSCTEYLNKLLKEKFLNDANKRFQIWLYMDSDDTLPDSLMASCHKVYLGLPTTVKESIIHLYELAGESRLASYTGEWSKWCLLSLALFHIGFVTRQSLEDMSTPLAQTLGDHQWEEAENVLRTLITENLALENNLLPLLIPQLTDIYITGALTESSYEILCQLLQVYLSPEAIMNVPGRVSALTHYTVPKSHSMEDHLTQLGYIYLAQNVSLTCVAPTLIFESQRDEAKSINISIYKISDDNKQLPALQKEDWVKYFGLNKVKKMASKNIQGSLQSIIKNDLDRYLKAAQTLVSKLKVNANPDTILEILEDNIPLVLENDQEVDQIRDIEAKLQRFSVKGHYLLKLINCPPPLRNIRLGLLREPAAAWSAFVRSVWGEVRGDGMEVAVVTKALWSELGQKGVDLETKTAGDEDEDSATLLMECMALCGASWDTRAELITTEELAAATPFTSFLDLNVMQFDGRVKKLMKKPGRSYRSPVYVNGDLSTPLFWVYLPLSPAITSHTCVLRGVRLVAS
ncbi:dynein axonemal heavy chain 2-like isoform X2 [Macrobrachium nipponense]